MSKLKLTSIVIAVLFILSLTGAGYLYMHRTDDLDCATSINLDIEHVPSQTKIQGTMRLFFHLVYGDHSYVSEYGTIMVNDRKYILDRNAKLDFDGDEHNGFHEVRRNSIDKNPQDNIPDAIYDAMTSKQKLLYFQVNEVEDGFWQIRDLRRTLIICKKQNKQHV